MRQAHAPVVTGVGRFPRHGESDEGERGRERLLKFSKQDPRYRYARQVIRLLLLRQRSRVAWRRYLCGGVHLLTCVPQQVLFSPPRHQYPRGHVQNIHVLWCYSHIVLRRAVPAGPMPRRHGTVLDLEAGGRKGGAECRPVWVSAGMLRADCHTTAGSPRPALLQPG